MQLIALAIAPGLAICLFIFHRDAYNREPKLNLLLSFLLGAAVVYPVALAETSLVKYFDKSIPGTLGTAFIVVALMEELGKFAILLLYAYRRKSFDEPLDGIVYAVMVSMGFATVENLLYVTQSAAEGYGYQVAIMRMFLAVPAHATFGVLMGYHVGKAKFETHRSARLLAFGLFWAVLFHGSYDFFLFLRETPGINDYVADWLLLIGAIISFALAIRLSLLHINRHRQLSQKTHRPLEMMNLRRAFEHDIPLIRSLADEVWPETYRPILSEEQIAYMMNMMYSEESIRQQMRQGDEFILVYDGVEPVGFASVSLLEPTVYKLNKLYVLPSQQGKGTGRFIVDKLAAAMKLRGGLIFRLNVNRHNKALQFYQKIGFEIVREEDIDIGNGFLMNDYVMEKRL